MVATESFRLSSAKSQVIVDQKLTSVKSLGVEGGLLRLKSNFSTHKENHLLRKTMQTRRQEEQINLRKC